MLLPPRQGGSAVELSDLDAVFKAIIRQVEADGPIGQRMGAVIDECERQFAHPDWAMARAIDYDADVAALTGWLDRAFLAHAGPAIEGLWFGVANVSPPDDDDAITAELYVAGAAEYDAGGLEWAYDLLDVEDENYLGSRVLAALYELAYGDEDAGLGNTAEYPLTLTYGAMAARMALEQRPLPPTLARLRGATVGFDGGDAMAIGSMVDGRFMTKVVVHGE
jgi:hypothetical protein